MQIMSMIYPSKPRGPKKALNRRELAGGNDDNNAAYQHAPEQPSPNVSNSLALVRRQKRTGECHPIVDKHDKHVCQDENNHKKQANSENVCKLRML